MMQEIIKKIRAEKDISEEEIKGLIKKKQDELSGLVSEEGAAYIVAKDLGINLLEKKEHKLEIKNLIAGMQNAVLEAKIVNLSDVYEFNKKNAQGKVRNMLIADQSGAVRVSLWNEEADKYQLEEGDIIRVNGYIKEDKLGRLEMRLGRKGSIEKLENVEMDVDTSNIGRKSYKRVSLTEVQPGMNIETRSAVLNFISNRAFFKVCPECGKRVEEKCEEHNADGSLRCAVSFIMDDGSESMRATMFNEVAESFLQKNVNELKGMEDEKKLDEYLKGFLGMEYLFQGRIQKNTYFDRPEMIVDKVKNVNIIKEIETMIDEYGLR